MTFIEICKKLTELHETLVGWSLCEVNTRDAASKVAEIAAALQDGGETVRGLNSISEVK